MCSEQNSIGAEAGATGTCVVNVGAIKRIDDIVDRRDGLLSRATAAKNLSYLLLGELERIFHADRGASTGAPGVRSFKMSDPALENLEWLVSELWSVCADEEKLAYELSDQMIPVSNAAFDAANPQYAEKAK